jgi:Na+/H+-translocating membrane pyrophosphatase
MSNRFIETIDHYISYRIFSILIFLLYLSKVVLSAREGDIPVFPSIWFTTVCSILLFQLTITSQWLHPINYNSRRLIKRILLASIPTILGTVIAVNWIKQKRKQQTEFIVYAGVIVIAFVLSVLSFYFIILLILLQVYGNISGLSIYLLTLGPWGMLGITIGDLPIFRSNDNAPSSDTLKFNRYQNANTMLSKLYFARKSRLLISTCILMIAIILAIFVKSEDVYPYSI